LSIGSVLLSLLNYFHYDTDSFFIKIYFFLFLIVLFDWFFTVNKESVNGFHTKRVQLGILKGMILFIASEIMFFFSIFWAFFHFKTNPSIYIGCSFPPFGINIIKANCFPLFNTVLLVYSGLFLMNSLNELKKGFFYKAFVHCIITIFLGIFFVYIQFIEYTESFFSFNDSCYGSVFFLLTGFHGFHVIVGLIFLLICCYRLYINYLKEKANFITHSNTK
jgi:heme/copper-type cytochrome/quinol oxidase subunit 3